MKNIKSIVVSGLFLLGMIGIGSAKAAALTDLPPADGVHLTWEVDQAGAERGFSFQGKAGVTYEVLWDDRTKERVTVADDKEVSLRHTYAAPGTYEVKLYGLPEGWDADYTETAFGLDMDMVYVAGGDFMMGCTANSNSRYDAEEKITYDTAYCYPREGPVHKVVLDDYYIGKFEITQKQWQAVMGKQILISQPYGVGANSPMHNLTWTQAKAFCDTLSKRTGRRYMLPTEAQWEYAARGGQNSRGYLYSGSDDVNEVAWYDTVTKQVSGQSATAAAVHPVGQKKPNELGLYDMSGNVDEWCLDWHDNNYYSTVTFEDGAYNPVNSQMPQMESQRQRVYRGGSIMTKERVDVYYNGDDGHPVLFRRNLYGYVRIPRRSAAAPEDAGNIKTIGFRVVCVR